MTTSMNEAALENLIVQHLVEVEGYELAQSRDYDMTYALDEGRLRAFLEATQGQAVKNSRIFDSEKNRKAFLERLKSEISKRGVVDVLRRGVKHNSSNFFFYNQLPSALSLTGAEAYARNKFSVVQQLHYCEKNAKLAIDVAVFLNGLPLLTMELKNNITGQTTQHAIRQYQNDRDPKNLLLQPMRCAVHFAADDESVAMCTKLAGKNSWFLPFNKGNNNGAGNPVNPSGVKTAYLWEEILKKERLSDILEHYAQVAGAEAKSTAKVIWPRYHQLEVVRALLEETQRGDVGQRFLIQHSAGSGKSNSITWLAYQLVEILKEGTPLFDSVLIITDRVNLDKQLQNNLKAHGRSQHLVGHADSSGDLRQLLKGGKKIILSTVQKFPFILESIGGELKEKRFAVIIDEAHSSQSGKMSAMQNQVLSGVTMEDDADGEDFINQVLAAQIEGRRMAPNANFYAFTATPKNKTLETFGVPFEKDGETARRPFHLYSMRQAIEEGFILDVLKNYTTYQSYYRIRKTIEDDPKFGVKQSMRKLRHFVESQPVTVQKKAAEMVEHFHSHVANKIGGEARCMICASGIHRAIDYFHAVNDLLEKRKSPYKAIVAFSGEVEYGDARIDEARLNGFPSGQIESTFRTGNYRFLIVADKFQTGYDEPLLQTMYVDKPLRGVKTVQTLSRLNRTCPKKEDTFVLDFVNTHDEVMADFQTFYQATLLSKETDLNRLNDLLDTVESYDIYTEEEIENFIHGFHTNVTREALDTMLDTMRERFCKLEMENQVKCKSAMKAFCRAYEFLSTIMEANEVNMDWERKNTVYYLLLRKLPSLSGGDLTVGLLDAVEFDGYRTVKQAEGRIELESKDAEVAPMPTNVGGMLEEDEAALSSIEEQFNTLFGNIDWKNPDVVRQQVEEVVEEVVKDTTLRNAVLGSDAQTAARICDDTTLNKIGEMGEVHMELLMRYFEEGQFQDLFNAMVRERVRNEFFPPYNEEAIWKALDKEFRKDFSDFCDGEHYVVFDEVLHTFFAIVNADTIPSLQGLRDILRTLLNRLYRAQYREEDYRT